MRVPCSIGVTIATPSASTSRFEHLHNLRVTLRLCFAQRSVAPCIWSRVRIGSLLEQHANCSQVAIAHSDPEWGDTFLVGSVHICSVPRQHLDHLAVPLLSSNVHWGGAIVLYILQHTWEIQQYS